jgi:hypothetical protein
MLRKSTSFGGAVWAETGLTPKRAAAASKYLMK